MSCPRRPPQVGLWVHPTGGQAPARPRRAWSTRPHCAPELWLGGLEGVRRPTWGPRPAGTQRCARSWGRGEAGSGGDLRPLCQVSVLNQGCQRKDGMPARVDITETLNRSVSMSRARRGCPCTKEIQLPPGILHFISLDLPPRPACLGRAGEEGAPRCSWRAGFSCTVEACVDKCGSGLPPPASRESVPCPSGHRRPSWCPASPPWSPQVRSAPKSPVSSSSIRGPRPGAPREGGAQQTPCCGWNCAS